MSNKKHTGGDIARSMSSAPLSSTIAEQLETVAGASITDQIAAGTAPEALVTAARESNAKATENPVAALFAGELTFLEPSRPWSRQQKDGSMKRLVANAQLLGEIISLTFGVFCTEKEQSDAEGKYLDQHYSIMLPMNFGVRNDAEADLEAWKYQILKQYENWAETRKTKNGVIAVAPSGARLIKKVRIPATQTQPTA